MANNEWGTPSKFIESARKVMGSIDVDPASNDDAQKVVNAKRYYTIKRDGLQFIWSGNVWLNPPYGAGLAKQFAKHLVSDCEHSLYIQAIVLTNNVTDVAWFNETIRVIASAFCFPTPRIQFIAPEGTKKSSNSKGQVISYIGDDVEKFCKEFEQYGMCVVPWRDING